MAGDALTPHGKHARSMTRKQQRFVEEYLIDLNATQAAIRAGYSLRNADKIGPQLLGKTRIAGAISAAMRERSERNQITQDRVIRGLLAEAERYGPDSVHAARVQAWKLLGMHLGMFSAHHRHGADPKAAPIKHDHRHDHNHTIVRADELKLDQETAEKVLAALRARKRHVSAASGGRPSDPTRADEASRA